MSQIRMDKTGASLTGGEGIDIFPVVEKTDLRRSRLIQRGDELADRGWSDLRRFASRTVVRAAAIVFVEGLRDLSFRLHGCGSAPAAAHAAPFPAASTFVPQQTRVLSEVKTPAGLARAAVRLANPLNWLRASSACRGPL